jgi:hypothetical protein
MWEAQVAVVKRPDQGVVSREAVWRIACQVAVWRIACQVALAVAGYWADRRLLEAVKAEVKRRSFPEASVEAGHLAAAEDWGCRSSQEAV